MDAQADDSLGETLPSNDPLSIDLRCPVVDAGDDFARGIAYETIRRHLFERAPGTKIGRYQLEKLIGRGGMGEVYSAHDPELDRCVAIKRILRRADEDVDEARRLREALMRDARSAARVQHPHVVEIYDCGLEGDELYAVMELVEGPTLDQWLDEHPRSWREIVEIFVQVGQGLAAAHAHGIVHRDFKPSNVLIGPDGRARVADFGLARMANELRVTRPGNSDGDGDGDGDVSLMQSLDVVGTPQYMAPEQYRGAEVSPRADQFAYCNSLYRALFRTLPFAGRTLEELATNVVEGRVRPPRDRHGAPRALVRMVLRGMAMAPEARHPSMDELVARLRAVLLRRRRIAWSGGVTAIAICTALGGYWWPRESPPLPCAVTEAPWTPDERQRVHDALVRRSSHEPRAVAPILTQLDEHALAWTQARQDVCEATLVRREQSDEVMDLRQACLARQQVSFTSAWSRLVPSDGPTGVEALAFVRQLAPASDCNPELVREHATRARAFSKQTDRSATPESEAQWRELSARLTNARAEAAVAHHARAHQEAVEVAKLAERDGLRYLQAEALLLQGAYGLRVARDQPELDRAQDALERAAPLAVESGSPRLAAAAFLELAAAVPPVATPEVRQLWIELAVAHADVLLPSDLELSSRLELVRGDLSQERGKLDDAVQHYGRAVLQADEGPDATRAALRLAEAQRGLGELSQARQTLQQLRESLERRGWTSLLAPTVHNLALVALDEKAVDEAQALCREADALYQASTTVDDLERQHARMTLARALRLGGELSQAQEILQGVVEALDARGLVARAALLHALDESVELELDLRMLGPAVATAERLLGVAEAEHPAEHPEVARARMMLAKAALMAGDAELALQQSTLAHAALASSPTQMGAEAAFRHAEAAFATGDHETAVRLLREVTDVLKTIPGSELGQQEVRQWAKDHGLEHDG